MEDDLKKKWKTTSKKHEPINLIGCDTIVNSPSYDLLLPSGSICKEVQFQITLFCTRPVDKSRMMT